MEFALENTRPDAHPFSLLTILQDGEDFRLIQDLLQKANPSEYVAVWEPDTTQTLDNTRVQGHDILLLDDRGGSKTTVMVLREARRKGVELPIVILTQRAEIHPISEYIEAGADDMIPRDRLNAFVLERILRHAVVHRRTLGLAYESEKRFHDLLAIIHEAMLIHQSGVLLAGNAAAAKLFGYTLEDIKNVSLFSLFPQEAREKVVHHETQLFLDPCETTGLKKDGSTFPLSFTGRPFSYHNQAARILTVNDLTTLKDRDKEIEYLLQRLRQDNERLLQSDRLKDEFMSSISGDFRSPLTAIVGYLRLLKMEGLGPLAPSQRDAVESADKNAHRLSDLVDDLLDLSRLDPGSVPLDFQELSPESLVDQALESLKPLADNKEIRLVKESTPGRIMVDPAKFSRVLSHLLGNSIKFTQPGGLVTLGSLPWKEGQHTGWLFFVKDTGVGIPEEELERVFDHFYRMDDTINSASSGSGIGLAISRRIVEAHGGRIWAESSPTSPGVIFKVFLPQVAA
jgi:PAS domain S-box-containing protein